MIISFNKSCIDIGSLISSFIFKMQSEEGNAWDAGLFADNPNQISHAIKLMQAFFAKKGIN